MVKYTYDLELDAALMNFSRTYCDRKACITSDAELNEALAAFKKEEFSKLKLWEFYVIDKTSFIKSFEQRWNLSSYSKKDYSNLNLANLSLKERSDRLRGDSLHDLNIGQRFSKTLDLEIACCFIEKLLRDKGSRIALEIAVMELEIILDEMNLIFYEEFDADAACIFEQIHNRAHYLRIAENGPKLPFLSEKYGFWSY